MILRKNLYNVVIVLPMIHIRIAKKEDLFDLAIVYQNAYNNIPELKEKWTDESALDLVKYFYNIQADLFFVAESEGRVVGGIASVVKPWWDGNHLTDAEIFVMPNFQKQGIGTRLMKQMLIAALNKYNVVLWEAYTHTFYQHPLDWYKRLGCEEMSHFVMISGNIKKMLKNIDKL